jgi:hypothetical protein
VTSTGRSRHVGVSVHETPGGTLPAYHAELIAQLGHFGIEELDHLVEVVHVAPMHCLVLFFSLDTE